MRETLSTKLFNTLKKGVHMLDKEALARIRYFVESQRTEKDSFVNKSGKEDLYYTMFGWILSYLLEIKLNSSKMTNYLSHLQPAKMDLIHYASYERCRILQRLFVGGELYVLLKSVFNSPVKQLHEFNNVPHGDIQSPYTQFIWLSLMEDMGNRIKEKEKILSSLQPYHILTGGYTNIEKGTEASTNATVAALAIKGQLNKYSADDDVSYLQNQQTDSGGFVATPYSPVPDILSTATALFLLNCYSWEPEISPSDFIEAHWLTNGGFSATILEENSDVEYTFYGLLALGTL